MTVPLLIKKLVRPFVPDRVMARFRLAQHSRQVRTNVDIVVDDPRSARRWLTVTPDTYRVRDSHTFAREVAWLRLSDGPVRPSDVVVIGEATDEGDRVARLLSDPGVDVGVLGEVAAPRLVGRRRAEPPIAPRAMAIRGAALNEIGGCPPGIDPLPALLQRARDAGHRLAVVPTDPAGAPFERSDPIDRPVAVLVSAVPIHDVGGGSRGAQLALAMLRHGFHVVYVALYGTAESVDLGLRFVHPDLEQLRLDQFDPKRLSDRVRSGKHIAIAELPAAAVLGSMADLKARGFGVVYDLIDDWSAPALGGEWYRAEDEATLVGLADVLVGSAPDLVGSLGRFGRPVTLIPNGVNAEVFAGEPGPCPSDFPPPGGPVIGYHGSLYGDWFDWAALGRLAEQMPAARVVLIGDDKGHPSLPSNVLFLGLKPHHRLLDYVARFDVGIVPFLVSGVTHAVSPLKVYEYLAAGVPVAAPPLRSLAGLDGVFSDDDLVAAVQRALDGPRPDRRQALADHSWSARLAALFDAAGWELPAADSPGATTVLRPVHHYSAVERRMAT
ncbi:MAG: hypothetical protein ACXW15_06675 [Acidimicrobiia bacterium]